MPEKENTTSNTSEETATDPEVTADEVKQDVSAAENAEESKPENSHHFIKGRDILIYLSLKHDGDWDKIYEAIVLREQLNFDDADQVLAEIPADVKVVTVLDRDYPRQFANIFKPPFVLYYKGDISLLSDPDLCVSVVGDEDCSKDEEETTKTLINGIVDRLNIVSGSLEGIEDLALETAASAGGRVIEILNSGINNTSDEGTTSKLILSEYPNNVVAKVKEKYIIDRNRLIAAASTKTLVIGAKARGYSVSTINYALYYGRDVLCVPSNKEGLTNQFIEGGAIKVETPEDILSDYEDDGILLVPHSYLSDKK